MAERAPLRPPLRIREKVLDGLHLLGTETEVDAVRIMDEIIAGSDKFSWWHRLTNEQRNKIDARTEDFCDPQDYWTREIWPETKTIAGLKNLPSGEMEA